jgi:hypothetical protein
MDSKEGKAAETTSAQEGKKTWIEKVEFEVLSNRQTDFTMMTYTNQPSRNSLHPKSA